MSSLVLELSDFVQIKTSTTPRSLKYRSGRCKFGDVLNHTAFVGGLRAGNFTNKGQVTTMETCQDLCCKQQSCDVAVMMKHTCFLVACKTMELCKARQAQLQHFSLLLSYRDRKAEEEGKIIVNSFEIFILLSLSISYKVLINQTMPATRTHVMYLTNIYI